MSKFTTLAGALIVSTLLISPFAMAEESESFVAQNEARHAVFVEHQEALAQAKQDLKTQQASAAQQQDVTAKHT